MTSIKSRFSALKDKFKRRDIKPLADRNRTTVGLVGIAIVVAMAVVGSLHRESVTRTVVLHVAERLRADR